MPRDGAGGSAPLWWRCRWPTRRMRGARVVSTTGNEVVDGGIRCPSFYASCWMGCSLRNRLDHIWGGRAGDSARVPGRRPAGSGRPRSRPFSWVTGLLSPAVRSRHWSEVPRRKERSLRLIAPVEPRVVLAGPHLADTDIETNEAPPGPVTRRTGESGSELRSAAATGPGPGTTAVRRGPGTAPGASSRARCRACRARPCSGRGSPSRGRGSHGGRPR